MTNKVVILNYLKSIFPMDVTNTDIENVTGVSPHSQVYQKTQELLEEKSISGWQEGKTWHFKAISTLRDQPENNNKLKLNVLNFDVKLTPKQFELKARKVFSKEFSVLLQPGHVDDVRKEWDLVSEDGSIVGDAKYYTLVKGKRLPPAKFATIAEHVWLLEKTSAKIKFLVFGNQIEVPLKWLEKYGNLVDQIQFFFMDDNGNIELLQNR